jgi:hypothetical protein
MLGLSVRLSCSALVALSLASCTDDPVSADETSSSSTAGVEGSSSSGPGDGNEATSVPGTSVDGTADSTVGATETSAEESTTGPMPCRGDGDCAGAARSDCEVGVCGDDGLCDTMPLVADTPCGDATSDECTAPDLCDGAGNCEPNHAPNASGCSVCAGEVCQCSDGVCGECAFYAPFNTFVTDRAVEGWQFTGSWGLWRAAPNSQVAFPAEFPGQVLGTDGNRVAPYPGAEAETSYARTSPTVLPAEVGFASWHVDEGGAAGSDNKTVRVSIDDGASWTTLADCSVDPSWAFCQPRMVADPAAWFPIQIPVPMDLQGEVGIVEFGYDTGDACCNFEQGWYIDFLTVATECACTSDDVCAGYSSTCGTGVCMGSGECGFSPMPGNTACGDPFANGCNGADQCDGLGYCRDNLEPTGLALCGDCPGGMGCSFCDDGQCLDCTSFTDFSDFSDPVGVAGWMITGLVGTPDWGLYDAAPPNQNVGSVALPFPNAPVYGIDGNRNPPYPGEESERSQVVTSVGVVPAEVTFISWNVDEGSFYDTKRIDISVDGGASWSNLVDCSVAATQPFCNNVADGRLADDWDNVTIDTSAFAGQAGQLRFEYDTGDSCCGFERGWYIDDLSFAAFCDDVAFP